MLVGWQLHPVHSLSQPSITRFVSFFHVAVDQIPINPELVHKDIFRVSTCSVLKGVRVVLK